MLEILQETLLEPLKGSYKNPERIADHFFVHGLILHFVADQDPGGTSPDILYGIPGNMPVESGGFTKRMLETIFKEIHTDIF